MIIKRPSTLEMPNPQHYKIGESCYEDEVEDEFAYAANPKKKRRIDGDEYYHKVMHVEGDGFSSGSSSWISEDASCWGSKFEPDWRNCNYKGRDTKRSSNRFRPPVLKSSKSRTQVLPSRYDDSVLVVGDTDSSFDGDDDIDIIEVKEGFQKKYNGMGKYRLGSSYYYSLGEKGVGYGGYNGFDPREYLVSRRAAMPMNSLPLVGNKQFMQEFNSRSVERLTKGKGKKRKDVYKPEDFALGDLVWAKCGRTYPAWPAVVIDPILQAPEAVLRCRIPSALCVMFFGYSKNGTQRDYGWVKQGMIFPFAEFMDRFQDPTQLHKGKMNGFQMALEEAILAENGFSEVDLGIGQIDPEDYSRRVLEAAGSSQDVQYYCQNQANFFTINSLLLVLCGELKFHDCVFYKAVITV